MRSDLADFVMVFTALYLTHLLGYLWGYGHGRRER